MAIKSGFYRSKNKDKVYNAVDLSSIFDGILNDGVVFHYGEQFHVEKGAGSSVNVKTGRAWFNHIWILNDAEENLTVEPSSTNPRKDLVVIQFSTSLDEIQNGLDREAALKVIKGTPAAEDPVIPDLSSEEYNTDTLHTYALARIDIPAFPYSFASENVVNLVGVEGGTPFVTCPPLLSEAQGQINNIIYEYLENESIPDQIISIVTNRKVFDTFFYDEDEDWEGGTGDYATNRILPGKGQYSYIPVATGHKPSTDLGFYPEVNRVFAVGDLLFGSNGKVAMITAIPSGGGGPSYAIVRVYGLGTIAGSGSGSGSKNVNNVYYFAEGDASNSQRDGIPALPEKGVIKTIPCGTSLYPRTAYGFYPARDTPIAIGDLLLGSSGNVAEVIGFLGLTSIRVRGLGLVGMYSDPSHRKVMRGATTYYDLTDEFVESGEEDPYFYLQSQEAGDYYLNDQTYTYYYCHIESLGDGALSFCKIEEFRVEGTYEESYWIRPAVNLGYTLISGCIHSESGISYQRTPVFVTDPQLPNQVTNKRYVDTAAKRAIRADVSSEYEADEDATSPTEYLLTLSEGLYYLNDGSVLYNADIFVSSGVKYCQINSFSDDNILTRETYIDGNRVYQSEEIASSGITITTPINVPDPETARNPTPKGYVDDKLQTRVILLNDDLATTGNQFAAWPSGAFIPPQTPSVGDYVLAKNGYIGVVQTLQSGTAVIRSTGTQFLSLSS